jgi:hypothetical protein
MATLKANNVYLSRCCQARADKPALVKGESSLGLGHWSCTKCGKACACDRYDQSKKQETQ